MWKRVLLAAALLCGCSGADGSFGTTVPVPVKSAVEAVDSGRLAQPTAEAGPNASTDSGVAEAAVTPEHDVGAPDAHHSVDDAATDRGAHDSAAIVCPAQCIPSEHAPVPTVAAVCVPGYPHASGVDAGPADQVSTCYADIECCSMICGRPVSSRDPNGPGRCQ